MDGYSITLQISTMNMSEGGFGGKQQVISCVTFGKSAEFAEKYLKKYLC